MGCCFSDQPSAGEDVAVRAPLLSPTPTDRPPGSARQYRATAHTDTQLTGVEPLVIADVRVANVDKRLKDHAALYNEHLQRRQQLQDAIRDLREMFPDNNPDKTLQGCFAHIKNTCRGCTSVTINRRFQYCMEIEYEGSEVHYSVIPAFLEFNKANKYIKEILDKGGPLVDSVQLVLDSEKDLRRDVLVASLGADGPDCMKNCINNIEELQKVATGVDNTRQQTLQTFEELKTAAQILLTIEDTLTETEDEGGQSHRHSQEERC